MIDIYIVDLKDITTSQVHVLLALLNMSEKQRVESFLRTQDKNAFIIGRALVRLLISTITNTNLANIEISEEMYGRPILKNNVLSLDFNISHSGDLVAIAITQNQKIGIDIEKISKIDTLDLSLFFKEEEQIYIENSKTKKEKKLRFFILWTAIEAYAKMLGLGLGQKLMNREMHMTKNDFCITLDKENGYITSIMYMNSYILAISAHNFVKIGHPQKRILDYSSVHHKLSLPVTKLEQVIKRNVQEEEIVRNLNL